MIENLLEALTIFCFGLSWPISIRKSLISRTAKGKSLFFEVFLLVGYFCGIARKIMQTVDGSTGFLFFLGFFFYILNAVEISIDIALYFRNKRLDEEADRLAEQLLIFRELAPQRGSDLAVRTLVQHGANAVAAHLRAFSDGAQDRNIIRHMASPPY